MLKVNVLRVQRIITAPLTGSNIRNHKHIKWMVTETNTDKEKSKVLPCIITLCNDWQEVLQVVADRRKAGYVGLVYNKKIVW